MSRWNLTARGMGWLSLASVGLLAVVLGSGCGKQQKQRTPDPRADDEEQAALANQRGTELYKQGRFKEAVQAFDDAIRLDSTRAVYYLNRGGARCASNDWDGAIADLDDAIKRDKKNPQAYGSRGYAYYKKGNFSQALRDYETSVRMDPKRADGYYNLARIYGTCKDARYRDGKKAIENARRACELKGWDNYVLLDTLAAAYAEAGDFKKAVEWQQKALDAASSSPTATRRLQARMDLYKAGKPFREDNSRKDFE